MRGYIVKSGICVTKVSHIKQRASGLYYFRLGIPQDVRCAFGDKAEINKSLQTHSESEAIKKSDLLAAQYKNRFAAIREGDVREVAVALLEQFELEDKALINQSYYESDSQAKEIGSPHWSLMEHLSSKYDRGDSYAAANPVDQRALDILNGNEPISLDMAKQEWLAKKGKNKKLRHEIERSFARYDRHLQPKNLKEIKAIKVRKAIDSILEHENISRATVKKELGHVRHGVDAILYKLESDLKNPFREVTLPRDKASSKHRHTFSDDEFKIARNLLIEKQHLVTAQIAGLQIDTGARIGEIGSLKVSDVVLDGDWPYLSILDKELWKAKNEYSVRKVPLVGWSLIVAQNLVASARPDQVYLFERYMSESGYKNDNCSNAVNALIRRHMPNGVSHSFRHKMKDRLHNASVTTIEMKNIMGWKESDMTEVYGVLQAVDRLQDLMLKMLSLEEAKGVTHTEVAPV